MEIRRAQPEDAKAIAKVHVDSWRSAYKGLIASDYLDPLSYDKREEMWGRLLASQTQTEHSFIFTACIRGEIIGFISGGRSRDAGHSCWGEISGLYILENYQRMGIGTKLMEVGVRQLQAAGFPSMLIWVLAENKAAVGFYEHLHGQRIAEGEREVGGRPYAVIGYGWDDLGALLDHIVSQDILQ